MSHGIRMLLRAELTLLVFALFPAIIYCFTEGLETAFFVFLGCFGVPQPFLVYVLRDQLFKKR